MPIDGEALELEMLYWKATGELRWRKPKDGDPILEQLWERVTGERSWRIVGTLFEG